MPRQPKLRTAPFFVVRSPLLPARLPISGGHEEIDRVAAFRDPLVRAALELASPSLAALLSRPEDFPGAAHGPLKRYVARMTSRSTPFQLCAGYSVGAVGAVTERMELCPRAHYRRSVRVDVDAIAALRARSPVADRVYGMAADVLILPDIVKIAARDEQGKVQYADLGRSAHFDALIERARRGATRAELEAVLEPFEADGDARAGYVAHLIELGLLVDRESAPVDTDNELEHLPDEPLRGSLLEVRDEPALGGRVKLAELAAELQSRSFIVDLVKPVERGALGPDVVREAKRVVMALQHLGGRFEHERMEGFASYLMDHFEGREVPLVEALDPERGFFLPEMSRSPHGTWTLSPSIQRRLVDGLAGQRVTFDEEDLEGVVPPELPESFALVAFLELTAQGRPRLRRPAITPAPGTMLFARATAFVPGLAEQVRAFLDDAAALSPDALVADVVYSVAGRSAAFVQFPHLQPYVIPLTRLTACPKERILDVNDLLVSARGEGRIMLRHAPSGREVRVRYTGAASPDRSVVPPLARFLMLLGRTEQRVSRFSFGPLAVASALPSVYFGEHQLAPRTFSLSGVDVRRLSTGTPAERRNAVARLREARRLPDRVVYEPGSDERLSVDLDDVASVDAWLDVLEPETHLTEEIDPTDSFVRGPEGAFHHELVLPFMRAEPVSTSASFRRRAVSIGETFDRELPGGDVLFLKVYGDKGALISLVTDTLRNILVEGIEDGAIRRWFFLPYVDPDAHVRLRLFGASEVLHGRLLGDIRRALAPLLRDRIIERVELSTYDRETYRYGGKTCIELVEDLFTVSSELAVHVHDLLGGTEDEAIIHRHHVGSLLALAPHLGGTLESRAALLRLTADRYNRAVVRMEPVRRAGKLFREFQSSGWPEIQLESAAQQRWSGAITELRRRVTDGPTLEEILGDVLHVHSTRILPPWRPTPHFEVIGYLVAEKILRRRMATAT